MTVAIRPSDTVIHVNRGKIDGNRKHQRADPPLSVRKGKTGRSSYGDRVLILDQDGRVAGEVIYDRNGILACGAKAVIIAHYGAQIESSVPQELTTD